MDEVSPDSGEVESPDPLLPEESVLTLEEYLAIQRAIGDEIRYRILRTLTHNRDLSANELKEVLDIAGNTLHYHLDTLVDVGLVQNRKQKRTDSDSDGLYSYYRATALGEAILEHGVEELMRREHEFLDVYSGSE